MKTRLVLCLALAACAKKPAPDAFRLRLTIPPAEFASALDQTLRLEMSPDHHVELIKNGTIFDAVTEEIGRAQKSINILMYLWEEGAASDRIIKALADRSKDVACRILVDKVGSPDFQKTLQPALESTGCEIRVFRPEGELIARNHRKIMVFDGSTAIVGGFGIRDDWLGDGVHDKKWRDTNVRFSGPAAADARRAFAENWQEAGGGLLPRETFRKTATGTTTAAFVGSTSSFVTPAERLIQMMISTTTKRIWISNAYFVPSPAIFELLCEKAKNGVDVRVLTSGKSSDSKTSLFAQNIQYDEMVECGMRVWEYLPSMLHAKTIVIDDHLVLVGSINLEPLSLTKLEESALIVDDPGIAAQLSQDFTADLAHAKEIKE